MKFMHFFCCLFLISRWLPVTAFGAQHALVRSELMMDTFTQITLYSDGQAGQKAMDRAYNYLYQMADLLSEFEEDSDISAINRAAGHQSVPVQTQTFELIRIGKELSQQFDPLYDISVGALSYPWKQAKDQERIPSNQTIQAALALVDYSAIRMDPKHLTVGLDQPGMRLDLGSIAKGYLADGVAKILKEEGISHAIINLGGNVLLIGNKPETQQPWTVGIQNPYQGKGQVVGSLPITDQSVVTSGVYERFFEVKGKKYHHLLDLKTGFPIDSSLVAVTIICPDSVQADALSTIIFAMGLEKGMEWINQTPGIEALIVSKDHRIYLSKGVKNFKLLDASYQVIPPNP